MRGAACRCVFVLGRKGGEGAARAWLRACGEQSDPLGPRGPWRPTAHAEVWLQRVGGCAWEGGSRLSAPRPHTRALRACAAMGVPLPCPYLGGRLIRGCGWLLVHVQGVYRHAPRPDAATRRRVRTGVAQPPSAPTGRQAPASHPPPTIHTHTHTHAPPLGFIWHTNAFCSVHSRAAQPHPGHVSCAPPCCSTEHRLLPSVLGSSPPATKGTCV